MPLLGLDMGLSFARPIGGSTMKTRDVAWRAVEICVVISVCAAALNSALTLGVTNHTTLAIVLTAALFATMWMFERANAKREEK
jgi:hypothetical protein